MSQSVGKGTNVGNSQMEWLYDSNSGKPTNDDYLMGKAVDKNFERMGTEGQINAVEYDCCPESIFSSQVDHQVDLQRKLQEDPLVSLKMKEVDTRKKILDNPLKMREINSYIESLKKKKHKKEKKRKKHKNKDYEKDDEDLDNMLLQKLKGISEEPTQKSTSRYQTGKSKATNPRNSRRESSSESSADERDHHKIRHKERDSSVDKHRSKEHKRKKYDSSPIRNKHYDHYHKDRQSKTGSNRNRFASPPRRRSRSPHKRENKRDTQDSSESERAKKLQEMMENANWREEQRTKKVKSHRMKESEEEAARLEKHDPSFLRKELSKAAESGSVEKRIKSNKHNIQRGFSSMSENFARR